MFGSRQANQAGPLASSPGDTESLPQEKRTPKIGSKITVRKNASRRPKQGLLSLIPHRQQKRASQARRPSQGAGISFARRAPSPLVPRVRVQRKSTSMLYGQSCLQMCEDYAITDRLLQQSQKTFPFAARIPIAAPRTPGPCPPGRHRCRGVSGPQTASAGR